MLNVEKIVVNVDEGKIFRNAEEAISAISQDYESMCLMSLPRYLDELWDLSLEHAAGALLGLYRQAISWDSLSVIDKDNLDSYFALIFAKLLELH